MFISTFLHSNKPINQPRTELLLSDYLFNSYHFPQSCVCKTSEPRGC